jgi:hypothetical protein
VAPWVKSHEAWGVGVYCFFNGNPSIHASHAFEVPDTPGVVFHDLLTISLNGDGVIDNVINNYGGPTLPGTVATNVVQYPPV